MTQTRLMLFSDVERWSPFERAVQLCNPDAILMGGDLTIDRWSSAWQEAHLIVPEFWIMTRKLLESQLVLSMLPSWVTGYISRLEKAELQEGEHAYALLEYILELVLEKCEEAMANRIREDLESIRSTVRGSSDAAKVEQGLIKKKLTGDEPPLDPTSSYDLILRMYAQKFYDSLKLASKSGIRVMTVPGNHDLAFFEYKKEVIESLPQCADISGEFVQLGEIKILGIGARETKYVARLKNLASSIQEGVDLVLAHGSHNLIKPLMNLNPKLVYANTRTKGGAKRSCYSRHWRKPFVFASFPNFVLVDWTPASVARIMMMSYLSPRCVADSKGVRCRDKWVERRIM